MVAERFLKVQCKFESWHQAPQSDNPVRCYRSGSLFASWVAVAMTRRAKQDKKQLDQVDARSAGEALQQAAVKPFTVALSRAENTKPSFSDLVPLQLAAAKVCIKASVLLRVFRSV